MVDVTLYYNADKNIVAQKHLTSIGSFSGDFRATADVLRPTLIIEGEVSTSANYVYIPDFHRYYYISERREITKDLTEFALYVDVRKSFYNNLLSNKGIVSRNENNYNVYLRDAKIPVDARKTVAVRKFNSVFGASTPCVVMLVLGG